MSFVLGLDIGGTHSRARLTRHGQLVSEAVGPSASLTAAGQHAASAALVGLIRQLGLDGSAYLDAICVGTAGTGARDAVAFLQELLGPLSRDSKVLVVNDARLVLASAGLDDGVACVAGTGSIAVGLRGAREERAGGWGYLLGDEGSGYWVAREALRELSRRSDAHAPLGPLGTAVLAASGCHDMPSLVQRWYDLSAPATWAAIAPDILDCPDPFSPDLLGRAAQALGQIIHECHERLGGPTSLPVVLAGGLLTGHDALAEATRAAVSLRLPQAPVILADLPPVAGAVRLAEAAAAALAHGHK